MNKRLYKYVGGILLVVAIAACDKEEIPVYTNQDFISFEQDESKVSMEYSFLGKPESFEKDTIWVLVNLIGNTADQDREINVMVADSSTASEGVDFKIVRPVLLPAKEVSAQIPVVLLRNETLKESSKKLIIALQDGNGLVKAEYKDDLFETFSIGFSEDINSLVRPSWWDRYSNYFPYSKIRHLQYLRVIGADVDPIDAFPELFDSASYDYTLYKLQEDTDLYNETHEQPLADEFGPIDWIIE
jgi:hypothetical protein|nr:DUF4843 domain-containing protein [uncultured Allomuricauda sp.]